MFENKLLQGHMSWSACADEACQKPTVPKSAGGVVWGSVVLIKGLVNSLLRATEVYLSLCCLTSLKHQLHTPLGPFTYMHVMCSQ